MSAQQMEYPRVRKLIYNERAQRDEPHDVLMCPPSDIAPRKHWDEEPGCIVQCSEGHERAKPKRRHSEAVRDEALRRVKAGEPQVKVAREMELTQSWLSDLVCQAGLSKRGRRGE